MLYKIVFSPTGGTDTVANVLCGALAETYETVDLSDSKFDGSAVSLTADDRAIIAMPCFGGLVPEVAVERLKALNGNGSRCAVVCVYGNRAYEDGLVEMEDARHVNKLMVGVAAQAIKKAASVRKEVEFFV